jgi:hypothetical protein
VRGAPHALLGECHVDLVTALVHLLRRGGPWLAVRDLHGESGGAVAIRPGVVGALMGVVSNTCRGAREVHSLPLRVHLAARARPTLLVRRRARRLRLGVLELRLRILLEPTERSFAAAPSEDEGDALPHLLLPSRLLAPSATQIAHAQPATVVGAWRARRARDGFGARVG